MSVPAPPDPDFAADRANSTKLADWTFWCLAGGFVTWAGLVLFFIL